MKLFDCIDGLFVGTRYLAWGMGLIGIVGSVILFFANVPLGFSSALVFLATFFLAIAVTLLLFPKQFAKGKMEGKKKYMVGAVSLVLAIAVMGITFASNGGFPTINLIFA